MSKSAIITAASNKFFPSLLNLLGSLRINYPNSPKIYVYDLGLFSGFRKELAEIENLEVLNMPAFCPFWRSCYTWKTYILSHPLAELNFYIDAGTEVLRPLDEVFNSIETNGYFAVGQGVPLRIIAPKEYESLFPLPEKFYNQQCITAGIFGFKSNSIITPVLDELFAAGVKGLALGFSPADAYRNKGLDKNPFVRGCEHFRHDTTLLSMLMRKELKDFIVQDQNQFAGAYSAKDHPQQVIWNLRMNYLNLKYLTIQYLHKKSTVLYIFNRIVINSFLFLRKIRFFINGNLWQIVRLKKSAQ